MNQAELKTVILEEIGNIAPEVEPEDIDPKADLRDEADIDSMDFLNLITALHERLKVDIPEIDYPKLQSVDGAAAYLAAKLNAG